MFIWVDVGPVFYQPKGAHLCTICNRAVLYGHGRCKGTAQEESKIGVTNKIFLVISCQWSVIFPTKKEAVGRTA